MNVCSWLKKTRNEIDVLDAELILLEILHERDRSFLVAHEDMKLNQNDLDVLDKLVEARKRGLPIAYILGRKEFYGREFFVNRNVLIPRPETENVVDIVKKLADSEEFSEKDEVKILDVGTGSGCIAVSVDLEVKKARVVALDISKEALNVAADNAINLGARVEFFVSDLFDKIRDEKFDIVVANLPYVDKDWDWLSQELEWEPEAALFSEDGGLFEIKRIIDDVVQLKNTKYLVLEADPSQHGKIIEYAKKTGLEEAGTEGFYVTLRCMSLE